MIHAHPPLPPTPKRAMMIGTYRVAGCWREGTPIYWIEPPRNAAGTRYLAIQQPRDLDRSTMNKLVALAHPHLARVLGQSKDKQGERYLIVDSVPGEPLDLVQETLGRPRATRVFESILSALTYLHEQGWMLKTKTARATGLIGQIEHLLSGDAATDTVEYDPVRRFQQAFALDAQDKPTMFDFTIWEPAPDSPTERAERVQQDMRVTIGLLYWLSTSGRLTKDLEILRTKSGPLEQFMINVLQETYVNFQELEEKFAQIARTPEHGATTPPA